MALALVGESWSRWKKALKARAQRGEVVDRLYRWAIGQRQPVRHVIGTVSRVCLDIVARVRRFHVSEDRSLTDWHMLLGTYEKDTLDVLSMIVLPGSVVVDVGAHIGFFAVRLAKLVTNTGRVYAYEPHPSTYRTLAHNSRRWSNIRLLNIAVSDRPGTAQLYESGGSTGSNSLVTSRAPYMRKITVACDTLDNLLRHEQRIDLVKVDVEGAELEVLRGMKETILRSPQLDLIIEFYPAIWQDRFGSNSPLIDCLKELGFSIYVISKGGVLRPLSDWGDASSLAKSVPKYVNLLARREA